MKGRPGAIAEAFLLKHEDSAQAAEREKKS
jgi:hypothetical protein